MCYREERQWGCRRKLHKLEGSAGSFASMVQLEQHSDLYIHSNSKDCHSSAAGSRKATSPQKLTVHGHRVLSLFRDALCMCRAELGWTDRQSCAAVRPAQSLLALRKLCKDG